ncbi:MAG TPA: dodecin family protein [Vicinamibacterales bacterium]|nr:dodecin family protein [Vicinamibacterales bacterium]
MAIRKVIEVISQSSKGWEEAAQDAISDASKTVKNIQSIYVDHFSATVKNGKIDKFRVNAKITFEIGK